MSLVQHRIANNNSSINSIQPSNNPQQFLNQSIQDHQININKLSNQVKNFRQFYVKNHANNANKSIQSIPTIKVQKLNNSSDKINKRIKLVPIVKSNNKQQDDEIDDELIQQYEKNQEILDNLETAKSESIKTLKSKYNKLKIKNEFTPDQLHQQLASQKPYQIQVQQPLVPQPITPQVPYWMMIEPPWYRAKLDEVRQDKEKKDLLQMYLMYAKQNKLNTEKQLRFFENLENRKNEREKMRKLKIQEEINRLIRKFKNNQFRNEDNHKTLTELKNQAKNTEELLKKQKLYREKVIIAHKNKFKQIMLLRMYFIHNIFKVIKEGVLQRKNRIYKTHDEIIFQFEQFFTKTLQTMLNPILEHVSKVKVNLDIHQPQMANLQILVQRTAAVKKILANIMETLNQNVNVFTSEQNIMSILGYMINNYQFPPQEWLLKFEIKRIEWTIFTQIKNINTEQQLMIIMIFIFYKSILTKVLWNPSYQRISNRQFKQNLKIISSIIYEALVMFIHDIPVITNNQQEIRQENRILPVTEPVKIILYNEVQMNQDQIMDLQDGQDENYDMPFLVGPYSQQQLPLIFEEDPQFMNQLIEQMQHFSENILDSANKLFFKSYQNEEKEGLNLEKKELYKYQTMVRYNNTIFDTNKKNLEIYKEKQENYFKTELNNNIYDHLLLDQLQSDQDNYHIEQNAIKSQIRELERQKYLDSDKI